MENDELLVPGETGDRFKLVVMFGQVDQSLDLERASLGQICSLRMLAGGEGRPAEEDPWIRLVAVAAKESSGRQFICSDSRSPSSIPPGDP